ncbi:MAG: acetate kinase [Candidatus Omnitrophota bacterium]
MKILVINCGSSSVKYELFDAKKFRKLDRGVVERIAGHSDHAKAMTDIKSRISDPKKGFLASEGKLIGIGHRVVHGGEVFKKSCIIDRRVIKGIARFNELAPLHNPPALAGIEACLRIFKKIPQVAVFDTAFHQTMPAYAFLYGLPYEYYGRHGIRRYGFHGTSHRFVSEAAAGIIGKPLNRLKIITVHLGNGCSMAAVSNGRSVDTSMGFTPLAGLLMGTRSGDLDPAIVPYIMEKEKMGIKETEDLLNKKSGFLGVSGISNDMRDILCNVRKGNARARLALDIFVYGIKKYIGAYAAAMGGLDAVVFTGGIGENTPGIRYKLQKELRPIFGNRIKFMVIPTNEELLIARDTYRLVKNLLKA